MAWIRFNVALILGLGLNVGLFVLLSRMTTHSTEAGETVVASKIEFVRLRREVEVEKKKREKIERLKPEQAPSIPIVAVAQDKDIDLGLDVAAIASGLGAEFGSVGGAEMRGVPGGLALGGGMSDRSALPLVRVEPEYPPQAARSGLEGWVQLRFSITTGGTVADVVVVKSSDSVFDRAAVSAVKKWKYAPQMLSGKPVVTTGVEVMLRFELEN